MFANVDRKLASSEKSVPGLGQGGRAPTRHVGRFGVSCEAVRGSAPPVGPPRISPRGDHVAQQRAQRGSGPPDLDRAQKVPGALEIGHPLHSQLVGLGRVDFVETGESGGKCTACLPATATARFRLFRRQSVIVPAFSSRSLSDPVPFLELAMAFILRTHPCRS